MAMSISGCKKLVEVDPPVTTTNGANVYASDATAAAVLTGIYINMSSSPLIVEGRLPTVSYFTGLSADELTLFSGMTGSSHYYFTNALTSSTAGYEYWNNIYPVIFTTNSAIEGLNNATGLTPAVKQQLTGEAMFMRAFCYFYLVNLYGDVPLITNTDYTKNTTLPRTPKTTVWQQIETDLKEAQTLLSANYLQADAITTTMARVRPTKWAATALLARTYLYMNDWANAEAQATLVINNTVSYDTVSLSNHVFAMNSREAIWQLQPVNAGWNTEDARAFILPATGPGYAFPVYLSTSLLNSFEATDKRITNWINKVTVGGTVYYYPYKYKSATFDAPVTEYNTVLRLAEQYLIRAEARAQQGDTTDAANDINIIRQRAGLANTAAATKADLLNAILHERQVEFFTEWGHRWLDLKRTGTVDAVMSTASAQKGGIWNTNQQLYPIHILQLQRNTSLVQNMGY